MLDNDFARPFTLPSTARRVHSRILTSRVLNFLVEPSFKFRTYTPASADHLHPINIIIGIFSIFSICVPLCTYPYRSNVCGGMSTQLHSYYAQYSAPLSLLKPVTVRLNRTETKHQPSLVMVHPMNQSGSALFRLRACGYSPEPAGKVPGHLYIDCRHDPTRD